MNTFKVNEGKNKKEDMTNNSHPGLRKLGNKFEGVFPDEYPMYAFSTGEGALWDETFGSKFLEISVQTIAIFGD